MLKAKLKAEAAFGHMGIAVKLGLLLLKRQVGGEGQAPEPALTAAALWERVWRRTDDVFCPPEGLLEPRYTTATKSATASSLSRSLLSELPSLGSRRLLVLVSPKELVPDRVPGSGRLRWSN